MKPEKSTLLPRAYYINDCYSQRGVLIEQQKYFPYYSNSVDVIFTDNQIISIVADLGNPVA